ncbi:hypothetical protein ACLBXB_09185 [Methylobacterium mesophilicum]
MTSIIDEPDGRRITTYRAWNTMKAYCNYRSRNSYLRDITYNPEWEDFEQFFADMGDKPSSRRSLRRIATTKRYEKTNCQWLEMPHKASVTITLSDDTRTLIE